MILSHFKVYDVHVFLKPTKMFSHIPFPKVFIYVPRFNLNI
jgi:hypothetical protein